MVHFKISVPKQILKDMYDYTTEPDEPIIYSSTEANEIYHDDQYFRESEAIPPAPKLHVGLENVGTINTTVGQGIKFNAASFDDAIFEGRVYIAVFVLISSKSATIV